MAHTLTKKVILNIFKRIQISKVYPLTKTELNEKSATIEMTNHQNFWKLSITHRSYEKSQRKFENSLS